MINNNTMKKFMASRKEHSGSRPTSNLDKQKASSQVLASTAQVMSRNNSQLREDRQSLVTTKLTEQAPEDKIIQKAVVPQKPKAVEEKKPELPDVQNSKERRGKGNRKTSLASEISANTLLQTEA